MNKIIFKNKSFQDAYEKSKFKIGDRVKIIGSNGCIKRYDRYIGTTATIIRINKVSENPNSDLIKEHGFFAFQIDSDKYSKFKSGGKRFPCFGFWECELEKLI